jgi:O-antigen ligase
VSRFDAAAAVLAVLTGIIAATVGTTALIVAVAVIVFAAAARTRRRFAPSEQTTTAVVLPLVLLPTVIGLSVFSERGVALIVWVLVCLAALLGQRGTGQLVHPAIAVALVLAILVPTSRFVTSSATQWWHVGAFLLLLLCAFRFPFPAVVLSLLDGIGIYLIANVAAYLVGIESPAAVGRTFSLDSSTGGVRIFFPLSGNLASPPLMAAVFVAAGLICFEGSRRQRTFRTVAFFAGVFIMVGANTRAALVASVVVLLASVLAPRLFARMALPVAAVPMVLPFVFPILAVVILRPLIQLVGAIFPFLSRGDVNSDVALEGRSDIWSSGLTFWSEHIDLLHRLVGYGELGRQKSGAAASYAHGDTLLLPFSAHNSTLQQLFDGGLLGVAALAVAGLGATWFLAADVLRSSRVHLIALCALVAGILGGGTEVTQAPGYSTEAFWIFVGLVLAASVGARVRSSPPEVEPTGSRGQAPRMRLAKAGM